MMARVCGVCGRRQFWITGEAYDRLADCVTGFQECAKCHTRYVFSRKATDADRPPDRRGGRAPVADADD